MFKILASAVHYETNFLRAFGHNLYENFLYIINDKERKHSYILIPLFVSDKNINDIYNISKRM